MPQKIIPVEGIGNIEFPDTMSDSDIHMAITKLQNPLPTPSIDMKPEGALTPKGKGNVLTASMGVNPNPGAIPSLDSLSTNAARSAQGFAEGLGVNTRDEQGITRGPAEMVTETAKDYAKFIKAGVDSLKGGPWEILKLGEAIVEGIAGIPVEVGHKLIQAAHNEDPEEAAELIGQVAGTLMLVGAAKKGVSKSLKSDAVQETVGPKANKASAKLREGAKNNELAQLTSAVGKALGYSTTGTTLRIAGGVGNRLMAGLKTATANQLDKRFPPPFGGMVKRDNPLDAGTRMGEYIEHYDNRPPAPPFLGPEGPPPNFISSTSRTDAGGGITAPTTTTAKPLPNQGGPDHLTAKPTEPGYGGPPPLHAGSGAPVQLGANQSVQFGQPPPPPPSISPAGQGMNLATPPSVKPTGQGMKPDMGHLSAPNRVGPTPPKATKPKTKTPAKPKKEEQTAIEREIFEKWNTGKKGPTP